MAFFPSVIVEPAQETDGFGRIRTSIPVGVFDSQLQYNKNEALWEEAFTGTGQSIYDQTRALTAMIVASATTDSVIRQSRIYARYTPGNNQEIYVSGSFGNFEAGVTKRIGYFDADNGLFFEQPSDLSGNLNVVLRSSVSGSPVETRVTQPNWNLDTLDGTGDSGLTVDSTKGQTYFVDLDWMSGEIVKLGVKLQGQRIAVHAFDNSNITDSAFMPTANLPIRYEIVNAGGTTGTMFAISASVLTNGATQRLGFDFSATNGLNQRSVPNGAELPIISVRPKLLNNGITNRSWIVPLGVNIFSSDKNIILDVRLGGTLTGASFVDVNTTASSTEFDVSATVITGGVTIANAAIASGGSISGLPTSVVVPLSLAMDGTHPTTPLTDTLTLVASGLSGMSNSTASISWREVR